MNWLTWFGIFDATHRVYLFIYVESVYTWFYMVNGKLAIIRKSMKYDLMITHDNTLSSIQHRNSTSCRFCGLFISIDLDWIKFTHFGVISTLKVTFTRYTIHGFYVGSTRHTFECNNSLFGLWAWACGT